MTVKHKTKPCLALHQTRKHMLLQFTSFCISVIKYPNTNNPIGLILDASQALEQKYIRPLECSEDLLIFKGTRDYVGKCRFQQLTG